MQTWNARPVPEWALRLALQTQFSKAFELVPFDFNGTYAGGSSTLLFQSLAWENTGGEGWHLEVSASGRKSPWPVV